MGSKNAARCPPLLIQISSLSDWLIKNIQYFGNSLIGVVIYGIRWIAIEERI
jgi:hypothetical protein